MTNLKISPVGSMSLRISLAAIYSKPKMSSEPWKNNFFNNWRSFYQEKYTNAEQCR